MNRALFGAACLAFAAFLLLVALPSAFAVERSLTSESTVSFQKPAPSGEAPAPNKAVVKQGGDTVNDAVAIPSIPYSVSGTTTGYTNNYDEECTYEGSTAPDVVYSYTPTVSGWANLALCNSLYDTKMYIYMNTVTAGLPFACNDDACGSDGYKSQLTSIYFTVGNTYYIVIDGYGTESGTYQLDITDGEAPVDYCPPDTTVYGQTLMTPDDAWSAGVSDVGFTSGPLCRYEDFQGLTTDITGLHFWAISAYSDGSSWYECDQTPRTLQINFYPDVAGYPGTAVATYTVSVTGTPTAFVYSGFTLDEYRVDLPSPVSLSDG